VGAAGKKYATGSPGMVYSLALLEEKS